MPIVSYLQPHLIPGGASSIEARLAQMKKDRVMAKRQAAASTKNKRDAFKQQLESQSSSKT